MTHWHTGAEPNLGLAQEAERQGFSSIWCEEAYGSDAVSPLAWVGASTSRIDLGSAVWQIPARTPAMAGMTAVTLDVLSQGRLRIGLGTSGPQVVEGWHGEAFERPVGRTREYVEILRKVTERKEPVSYEGKHYQLPYKGDGGLGLGKPLKLIIHPNRPQIPIYIGALGPKNIELTAELADGWLPIFFAPRIWEDVFGESLTNGFAKSAEQKAPGEGFDVAPVVSVVIGDDVDECRREVKQRIALYIGGMGHAKKNFSNQLIRRFGYDKEADEIQSLFLGGEREAAVDAVPDELIDDVALCGPVSRIDSLLDRWRESPVTTIICDTDKPETIVAMAELLGTAKKASA